jgi:hypothetical protein
MVLVKVKKGIIANGKILFSSLLTEYDVIDLFDRFLTSIPVICNV